jgi:positive regulator of sigma E activity
MKKEKTEFSKALLIQESILVWIVTIAFIILAYICIINDFMGELPWLTTIVAFPWTAYGVSAACYYKKSEKENTKDGIKFESVMAQMGQVETEIFDEVFNESEEP